MDLLPHGPVNPKVRDWVSLIPVPQPRHTVSVWTGGSLPKTLRSMNWIPTARVLSSFFTPLTIREMGDMRIERGPALQGLSPFLLSRHPMPAFPQSQGPWVGWGRDLRLYPPFPINPQSLIPVYQA